MNTSYTIQMQIALNKKLYDTNVISYDMYSKVNDILISRLEQSEEAQTAS